MEYNRLLYRRYPNKPEPKSIEFLKRLFENIRIQKKSEEIKSNMAEEDDEDDLLVEQIV